MKVDMIAGWCEPEEKIGELDIRLVRGREVVTASGLTGKTAGAYT